MVLHKAAARGVQKLLQWNLDITKSQGTDNILFAITRFRYIEVLFHIFNYRPFPRCCKQRHQLEARWTKYSELYEIVHPSLVLISFCLLT